MSDPNPPTDAPPARPTWGPYPGDATAPPPTPQAPEIPMSSTWPVVAGAAIIVKILIPIVVALVFIVVVIAALAH